MPNHFFAGEEPERWAVSSYNKSSMSPKQNGDRTIGRVRDEGQKECGGKGVAGVEIRAAKREYGINDGPRGW